MSDLQLPLLEPSLQEKPAKPSTLLTVCPFILGNEFCERLAFYGLATNLVTYISNVMGGDPGLAAIQVSVFEGMCYTTPLIGAILADSFWGRYKTILVFSLIYIVGLGLLTASSSVPGLTPGPDDDASTFQFTVLACALATIALGTGGIKPNVSAFGADQFNVLDPQDAVEKASFFGYFYLAINIGSFIACTVIVYIQDSVSWTLGFAIPGVAMVLGVILFVAGQRHYRHVHPTESPMSRVVKVVYAALQNRWKKKAGGPEIAARVAPGPDMSSLHGAQHFKGPWNGGASSTLPALQHPPPHLQQRDNLSNGRVSGGADGSIGGSGSLRKVKQPCSGADNGSTNNGYDAMLSVPSTASMSYRWLEDAITEWQTSQGHLVHVGGGLAGYTPQQVEEVKLVLRLLPVFMTTVLYWTTYTQMGAMFVQQGSVMQHDFVVAGQVWRFPSASMGLFNTVAIILLIPFYDRVFEPLWRRCGRKITMLQRIGAGMGVCIFAMLAAAGIEAWRLQSLGDQNDPDGFATSRLPACSKLTIFWQVPQYFLIGVSEVFTSIGMLEFFYDQAPDVMRSCSMALNMLSTAIGSYLSGALVAVVQAVTAHLGRQWLPRNLNEGRLDLFFLFLAGLMLLNLAIYILVAVKFEYKPVEHRQQDSMRIPSLLSAPPQLGSVPSTSGGQSFLAPLPSQPPRFPGSVTAPMGIGRRNALVQVEDSDSEALVYGRSLAYVPASPALPPNFR